MNARRCQIVAVVSFSLLLVCGCGSENKDASSEVGNEDTTSEVSYDSPQAVFDAAKASVDKDDWSAFCMCLEPDSRDKLAAIFAMMSSFDLAFSGEKGDEGKKQADAIKAVFAKHGITDKMLEDDPEPTGTAEDAMMDFIKPIKDRKAFVADMGKVVGGELKGRFPIQGETKLSDVKEDGETASGTMTFKVGDEDKTDTIEFKKGDGGWSIVIPAGP